MLNEVMATVIRMSFASGAAILAVLLARHVFKHQPKQLTFLLWVVVLFRLFSPAAISSPVGGIPVLFREAATAEDEAPDLPAEREEVNRPAEDDGNNLPVRDDPAGKANAVGQGSPEYELKDDVSQNEVSQGVSAGTSYPDKTPDKTPENPESSTSDPFLAMDKLSLAVGILWLSGLCAMAGYGVYCAWKVRRMLVGAVPVEGNIWEGDYIRVPFVYGILSPRVCLPSELDPNDRRYVICHEQSHIRRGDHLTKLLFYAALCIHWFNPLVWIGFYCFAQDMEMACDEAALRRLGEGARKAYSQTLLNLTIAGSRFSVMPLAFGEGNTKQRIKRLSEKRRAKTTVTILCAVCIGLITVSCGLDHYTENSAAADESSGSVSDGEETNRPDSSEQSGTENDSAKEEFIVAYDEADRYGLIVEQISRQGSSYLIFARRYDVKSAADFLITEEQHSLLEEGKRMKVVWKDQTVFTLEKTADGQYGYKNGAKEQTVLLADYPYPGAGYYLTGADGIGIKVKFDFACELTVEPETEVAAILTEDSPSEARLETMTMEQWYPLWQADPEGPWSRLRVEEEDGRVNRLQTAAVCVLEPARTDFSGEPLEEGEANNWMDVRQIRESENGYILTGTVKNAVPILLTGQQKQWLDQGFPLYGTYGDELVFILEKIQYVESRYFEEPEIKLTYGETYRLLTVREEGSREEGWVEVAQTPEYMKSDIPDSWKDLDSFYVRTDVGYSVYVPLESNVELTVAPDTPIQVSNYYAYTPEGVYQSKYADSSDRTWTVETYYQKWFQQASQEVELHILTDQGEVVEIIERMLP